MTQGAADSPAESGIRRFGEPGGAHTFGDTFEEAIADGTGGVGRYVAKRNAGSPGGDDETCPGGSRSQCVFDALALVWY